jgi:hypothetical protein
MSEFVTPSGVATPFGIEEVGAPSGFYVPSPATPPAFFPLPTMRQPLQLPNQPTQNDLNHLATYFSTAPNPPNHSYLVGQQNPASPETPTYDLGPLFESAASTVGLGGLPLPFVLGPPPILGLPSQRDFFVQILKHYGQTPLSPRELQELMKAQWVNYPAFDSVGRNLNAVARMAADLHRSNPSYVHRQIAPTGGFKYSFVG